jgi:formate dehydrogenase beta subunit
LNCTEFFRNESCGKCVPCRVGSEKLVEIAAAFVRSRGTGSDFDSAREIVRELAQAMEMTSICGLGVAASNPLISWMKYFRSEPAPLSATTEGKSKSAERSR